MELHLSPGLPKTSTSDLSLSLSVPWRLASFSPDLVLYFCGVQGQDPLWCFCTGQEMASCKTRSSRQAFWSGSLAPPLTDLFTLRSLSQRCPGARPRSTACSVLLFLFYKPRESKPEILPSGICRCQPVISFLIYCVSSFDNPCHM